mgnify:CR=1 FL=1
MATLERAQRLEMRKEEHAEVKQAIKDDADKISVLRQMWELVNPKRKTRIRVMSEQDEKELERTTDVEKEMKSQIATLENDIKEKSQIATRKRDRGRKRDEDRRLQH